MRRMRPPAIPCAPMSSSRLQIPDVIRTPTLRDLPSRICVRPPYFALRGLQLEGRYLSARATAEAPAFLEVGPMTAAELGRHAAITGLCHAAAEQNDDRRRYYLAQHAECRYVENPHPYRTPVALTSRIVELTKRVCNAHVSVTAGGDPLAEFDVGYTILTEAAFERLFRSKAQPTPPAPSPYGRVLERAFRRDGDLVEQEIENLPAEACVGHFDGYPALPVAVVMGQLSYLAGQLFGDGAAAFRVTRGSVDASDLAWAGETARFRARRVGMEHGAERFECDAFANDRRVGSMILWLRSVEG